MDINHLATMLPRMCMQAGTQKYTNHCLRSTTIQKLSDAGLDTKEIMAVSGHKCEMATETQWPEKVEQHPRHAKRHTSTSLQQTLQAYKQ